MAAIRETVARGLASAFLAGEWSRNELLFRATDALGTGGRWLRFLVHDVLAAFPAPPHDVRDSLARFILSHEKFQEAWSRRELRARFRHWYSDAPAMALPRWPVRRLDTLADVAQWLNLDMSDLEWLADRKGLERVARETKLQNYRYTWVLKRSGGARLLESPKSRLKAVQRRILHDALDVIPAHDAAHGFRQGRSVLTHARLHVAQPTVIRFDLESFFASVHTARAYGVFRAAGYPEEVSRTLIGLCTNRAPHSVLHAAPRPTNSDQVSPLFRLKQRLSAPHLPQGSPTSPALANLCAYGLDVRLEALAKRLGANYSRYADDLTFSGDQGLAGSARRLQEYVAEAAREEGFALNRRKTWVMGNGARQQVTGIVVNRGVNVGRDEADRLKAILHNCVRHGPASQVRGISHLREHLQGRISWVEYLNPSRGSRLRRAFEQIQW
jgi:RNA-directed DNA polymerase